MLSDSQIHCHHTGRWLLFLLASQSSSDSRSVLCCRFQSYQQDTTPLCVEASESGRLYWLPVPGRLVSSLALACTLSAHSRLSLNAQFVGLYAGICCAASSVLLGAAIVVVADVNAARLANAKKLGPVIRTLDVSGLDTEGDIGQALQTLVCRSPGCRLRGGMRRLRMHWLRSQWTEGQPRGGSDECQPTNHTPGARLTKLLFTHLPHHLAPCLPQMLIEAVKSGCWIGVDGVYLPKDPASQ